MTIVVIAAEGDSAHTEQVYVRKLKEYYRKRGVELDVELLVFAGPVEGWAMREQIWALIKKRALNGVEIHAQAGLGARLAYEWMRDFPERVRRVFLVGGAPSDAMNWLEKVFHRYISRLWYYSPIRFFADDPNPYGDAEVTMIRDSSTAAMRADPKLYRDELVYLSEWRLAPDWRVPTGCKAYFIPNGETKRSKWRDNSFDNAKATEIWAEHGVEILEAPKGFFSMYSMMPAEELFRVMDTVRTLR